MSGFVHERHKPAAQLERPRELLLALPPMRSRVNLSRIVRLAGCCGVRRVIACGAVRVDRTIARQAADYVQLEVHRTLPPVLQRLKRDGYTLVGLEQATGSIPLYQYRFARQTVLVLGHERLGIEPAVLELLEAVVEIPVYGQPASHNIASAAAMALYEYCRQWPAG